ncbi:hypothetical protein [Streptomyces virginiae]|uniref:hypothetical protein n=1 Tax=Streptomyces virginiae TaxID=1961 RepID=UPI002E2884E8|nr:hypothetical protein [Streptomyces virginiae]
MATIHTARGRRTPRCVLSRACAPQLSGRRRACTAPLRQLTLDWENTHNRSVPAALLATSAAATSHMINPAELLGADPRSASSVRL